MRDLRTARLGLLCLTTLLLSRLELSADAAGAWGQWRGPEGTGVAPHSNPPVEWSEETNIRWKVAIPGKGHASPIVWGDRIFLLTAIKTDEAVEAPTTQPAAEVEEAPAAHPTTEVHEAPTTQPPVETGKEPTARQHEVAEAPTSPPTSETPKEEPRWRRRGGGRGRGMRGVTTKSVHEFAVLALDRQDGSVLWQQTLRRELPHEGTHNDGSWASSSPVTDGEHLYVSFGSRGIYCLDMEGNLQWEKDLGRMKIRMSFGEGSSPALLDDRLIVNFDHEGESFIVALSKKTGEELWRMPRDERTSWATPLVVEHDGRSQIITNGTTRIRSYDGKTGELIWEAGGMTPNAIPSPVTADGVVYLMSGFRGNALLAIPLARARGDITDSDAIAWTLDRDTPYTPSPLLYGDNLYFLKGNNGVLTCLDPATGDHHFGPQRLESIEGVYASPVGASGRVYIAGRNGVTLVIKQGPEFEVLAENHLDESFSASAAIAGDEIFLRGQTSLYCIATDE
mgnify:CR=1 FL=1